MKKFLILTWIVVFIATILFLGISCKEETVAPVEEAQAVEVDEEEIAEEITTVPVEKVKITIGLSPYQDVSSPIFRRSLVFKYRPPLPHQAPLFGG